MAMLSCPKCQASLAPSQLTCPACGADASLWIARAGEVFGPYTSADLRRAQAEGRLGAEDQVKVGDGEWEPLKAALTSNAAQTALPPPPPPVVHATPPATSKSDSKTLGIVLAAVAFGGFFVIALLAAIMFPVFARAREKARQASCMSNMKQLSLAMLMYCQDYEERFPPYAFGSEASKYEKMAAVDRVDVNTDFPVGDWRRVSYPYVKNAQIFVCPSTLDKYSYQFNEALFRLTLGKIRMPSQTLCVYESGFVNGFRPPPHNDGYNAGFVDGHVKWLQNRDGVTITP
ncbi:MAG: DUF1559 domain-containing protein [Armatimonadota bacterium]